jgi:hypothetical protein
MHTADLALTERLAIDPGTRELTIGWTIVDPVIFKEPHSQQEAFVRTERWNERYDCKPGYRQ